MFSDLKFFPSFFILSIRVHLIWCGRRRPWALECSYWSLSIEFIHQNILGRSTAIWAFIRKRRYWPTYVPGEEIKARFIHRGVGDVDCWYGKLEGLQLHLHYMREPDYIMSLMSTYGTMERFGYQCNAGWSILFWHTTTQYTWFQEAASKRIDTQFLWSKG